MSDKDGYCKHGVYVGGCGIDWMCGICESGITDEEYEAMCKEEALADRRKRWYDAYIEKMAAGLRVYRGQKMDEDVLAEFSRRFNRVAKVSKRYRTRTW